MTTPAPIPFGLTDHAMYYLYLYQDAPERVAKKIRVTADG